jgi:anti-sigma factor RsiW
MAEQHPADDLLLDLVLGELAEPQREQVVRHLSSCQGCRNEYDAISTAVDQTLLAAPRVEPGPGFDRKVLDAMGLSTPSTKRSTAALGRRPLLQAAAVAVLGAVVGAGATWAVLRADEEPDRVVLAENSAHLRTKDGQQVGTVTRSWLNAQPVLVVEVTQGKVGKRYECRLRLAGGAEQVAGDWVLRSERGATWVVSAPESGVVGVELVTDTGAVWSSATL